MNLSLVSVVLAAAAVRVEPKGANSRTTFSSLIRVYETLIKDDQDDLLFGPFGSTLTAAAVNPTDTNKNLMVNSSAYEE